MSRTAKIIINVIYYLACFLFGILLAVMLPNWYIYDMSMNTISDSLNSGNYDQAMELVGGYFYEDPVYTESVGNGGIVIFEAATMEYGTDEEGKSTVTLQKSYAGYLYDVDYLITSNENNLTEILITDGSGQIHHVSILDYSSDGDDILDTVSTFYEKGFLYFDFYNSSYDSIASVSFVDCSGAVFLTISPDGLDYSSDFFTDVTPFLEEYNKDYSSSLLSGLDEEFRAKNAKYRISSYGDSQSAAQTKAMWFVLIYFILIYVIGDLTIGKRYLIKLVKWILTKVFKVNFEKKQSEEQIKEMKESTFGHDYYSQVTVSLDLSEVPDFHTAVSIRYSNEAGETLEFQLMESSSYTVTKRVHAGVYVNPWMDVDSGYAAVNLPDNLVVEGYKMNLTVKIKERT